MPLLLIVLIGAVQFALVQHTRLVAETAAIEGARRAAAAGQLSADGALRARELLDAGLGASGGTFAVRVETQGDVIVTSVAGDYPLFIPWVTDLAIPVEATGVAWREGFRDGP